MSTLFQGPLGRPITQKWIPVAWSLDIRYIYPEITLPDGTKQTIRTTQRKMFVTDGNAVTSSGQHRIFVVTRKGAVVGFSLATIPRLEQSKWTNPTGEVRPWYKFGEEYKRDGKTMDHKDFQRWLEVRLGKEEATIAYHKLLNEMPPK